MSRNNNNKIKRKRDNILVDVVLIIVFIFAAFTCWHFYSTWSLEENDKKIRQLIAIEANEKLYTQDIKVVNSVEKNKYEVVANNLLYYAYINPSNEEVGIFEVNGEKETLANEQYQMKED